MKSNFLKYILASSLLSLVFLTEKASAQVNSSKGVPSFTNYVVGDDNLAGQQVWNVNQNKDGYLFVGTSSGLQKFDGRNWELLTSPTTEFNTNVRSTLLASDGTFYFGSLGDFGLVTTDSLGKTIEVSLLDGFPSDMVFNDVWSIRESKGKIYFQAREAIFIYTPGTESTGSNLKVWKPDTEFMYGFSLDDTYYTHQINLGLFKEENGSLSLIPGSEFLGEERVQVLLPYQDSDGFLVGAFSGGIFRYDGTDFKAFPTEIDSLLQTRSLYKALSLPDDTYALSVLGHGFFVLDQQGKIKSHFNTKNSITDQSVYAFHLDNTSNLWVGTNSGLSKIEIFSPITRFDSDQYEIGSPLSLGAYDDNLYIGTSTNVLYLDKTDGLVKKVEGVPNTQVFDLEPDGNQILSTGVGIYSHRGSKSKQIPGTENLQTLKVVISEFHPGYVFISGGFGIEVFKRERDSSGEYQYENVGAISGVQRSVYSLAENQEGELWGGTQAGVLFRIIFQETASGNLDVANARVVELSEKDGVRGLSGLAVGPIEGKVYTSGIDGFYFFNASTNEFERDPVFSFSDEVANINLDTYGLGVSETGNVYLDFKGEKRLAVRQADGSFVLNVYPFNLITTSFIASGFTEPSGVIWVGTDGGLLRIDPNKEYRTDHPLPLYFTKVSNTESNFPIQGAGDNPKLEIPFKGNSIRFGFASPFFVKESQIRYQTFLEGLDEDWSDWGVNVFREFSNLPYGSYTFKVRAKNTFGTISDEIAYTFVILPPWYATWWAFMLYFFAFGLVVYGVVKVQTGRVLAREKVKTQERELAQAREIEKAYRDLKATQAQLIQSEKMASLGELTAGIAHEIQNPLNFVNNFADLNQELIDELEEEIAQGNLAEVREIAASIKANEEKIKQHGRRADLIVKGMLQHSRANSGEKKSVDLNSLAEEFVKLSYHGLRAKDKSFNADFDFHLDPNLPQIDVVEQDIGRVILNLINNAFYAVSSRKESNGVKDYKPMVTLHSRVIKLGDTTTGVELCIEDNGSGIPKAIKDKIFQPFFTTKPTGQGTGLGLSLSYDIIRAHGGDLRVKSKEGEGTEMIIFLPIVV
ncbi:ATP-binding protein [Algoriphagus namhaensis]